jgi:hypothetical protein
MKKVETVTFHLANNYGAVLQAYALQKIISQRYDTEILNYDNKFISNNYKVFKPFSKNPIKTLYHLFKDICDYKKESVKSRLFDNFRNDYLEMSNYFEKKDNPIFPKAAAYIVGSDQVWNPFLTGGVDRIYLLDEIKDTRKISYAASSGNLKYIDNKKDEFFSKYNNFDRVSVREEKLKKYLEKNSEKKVDVVVDPTLLMSKEMWKDFAGAERIEKEKYIFVYSVNNSNELFVKFVNKFAKENNLKIVYFDKRDIMNKFKGRKKSYYETGPKEFVNLLYYSEYVITTSFHGTALSCILNKKFYVVLSTFPDRLDTILETLDLKSRVVNDMNDYDKILADKIDWKKSNKLLEKARIKSLKWLFDSIECDKNE